ncbi:MAG TPA: cupin domain-containing protein [Flavisolibacter sp.]|nr:cupin domain-containing protein [Flavisolibacter sp.]
MNTTEQNSTFQLSDEILWEDAGEGIRRQALGFSDELMLVKVAFEKGAIGALHQHPHTQASYVESGLFELEIGGEKKVLKAGDGYFVPPNVIHGCTCLEAGVLIDCFTPHREDFVN